MVTLCLFHAAKLGQELDLRLELDLQFITDGPETIALVVLVPKALVWMDVGMHLAPSVIFSVFAVVLDTVAITVGQVLLFLHLLLLLLLPFLILLLALPSLVMHFGR